MRGMFDHCKNLSELNLSSFNTNNATTDMSYMFFYCENLKLVKINKLNIKKFKDEIGVSKLQF